MTPNTLPAPSRWRRLACLMYEGVLLFGVVFIAGYLFDTITQSRHALTLRHERQLWLFMVLGLYFVWFWTHGGQPLAMKTWHIKLQGYKGSVTLIQAVIRYCLCWILTVSGIGFLWSFIDKDKQYLQDRLAKTHLVDSRPQTLKG